jgi:hypothetical protein
MSTPATQIIPIQRTVTADPGNADIPRGSRVVLQSNTYVALAAIGVRGDYITTEDIAAGTQGLAAPINCGGSVAVIAATSSNVADLIYSAASGKAGTTSTSAVLLGKALQAFASGSLAIVELESVQ